MKKTLLFVLSLISIGAIAQVEIEPFAPSVPGTYIGDFSGVATLSSVTASTTWTSEGTGTGPYAFVGDNGATLFSFVGSVGNYCAAGFDVGQDLTLVSPEMDFGSNTANPTLNFRWGQSQNFGGSFPTGYCVQTLEVMYKEGVAGSWNNLITITTLDASPTWHDEVVDLSVVTDFSQLYLGFKVSSITAGSLYPTVNYGQTVFDEIVVTGEPGCTASNSNFSVDVCDMYTVPSGDETYSTPGVQTVMDTIPNSGGCDSVMTISLTINTVDPAVTDNGDGTLTANAAGATYQWLENCGTTPTAMSGETNQTLNPGADGMYSCVVTQNGCTDTSACMNVVFYSIDELDKSFSIYPNPSNGMITLDLTGISGEQIITVTAINGDLIMRKLVNAGSSIDLNLAVESGVYVISLVDNDGIVRKSKLIIE